MRPARYRYRVPALLTGWFLAYAAQAASVEDFMAKLNAAGIYEELPNVPACRAGVLKQSEKQRALSMVNRIRELHGLPPVRYDDKLQDGVMQAALMMSANVKLDHAPTPNWKCYSKTGAEGAENSNLAAGQAGLEGAGVYNTEDEIIDWLVDDDNVGVGHRLSLLDPFVTIMAYGRVSGVTGRNQVSSAGALRIDPVEGRRANVSQNFVAYPQGNYPKRLFPRSDIPLSFSVILNQTEESEEQKIDLSKAQVTVMDPNGQRKMRIADKQVVNDGNALVFKVDGLLDGAPYSVTIRGVRVGGRPRDYTYSFKVTP